MPQDSYTFENKILTIVDPELGFDYSQPFAPVYVDGELPDGYQQRERYQRKDLVERWIEKEGILDGQSISYYPGHSVVFAENFYQQGKLHGPARVYALDGTLLAETWYIDGLRQGKSRWYYPSGSLYSQQRFKDDLWQGIQLFYQENGALKSTLHYEQGRFVACEYQPTV